MRDPQAALRYGAPDVPAVLALLIATLLAHAAQWIRPSWSGTEGLRVLVAHSMVTSGDYLVPKLGGETLLTKPPLFYWLLAGMESLAGVGKLTARLPALLSIWWCSCAALGTVTRLADRRSGWFAALCVILAPSVLWHGAFAEIDPLFMSLCVVALLWLLEGATTGGGLRLLAAGLVGAAALMTKGPPFFMFLAVPLVVALRSAPRLVATRFVPALIVPIAAFLWVFLSATKGDGSAPTGEAAAVAASETIGRIGSFDWNSVVDLPLHLLRTIAATLPFTPFAWAALCCRDTTPIARLERACVLALVVAALMLAVFPMRPPRYLLPGIPLVAIASARRLAQWTAAARVPPPLLAHCVRGLGVLAAIACFVLPWLAFPFPGRSFAGAIVLGIAACVVRTRTQMFACLLLAPAVVVATVQQDRAELRERGLRDEEHIAAILRSELRARGVEDFEFWGNPGESLALYLDPDARWRDRQSREIATDLVIARWYDGQ